MKRANVFLFAGLPGCGKSIAAQRAYGALEQRKYHSVEKHELSDYVRSAYEKESGISGVGDNELGEWAAQKKTKRGDGYFARQLAEDISNSPHADNIVVAGIRSSEEVHAFRERFDNVIVLSIWALPDERYTRLENREGEYTLEEFNDRKQRELWSWGCIDFFTDEKYYNHIIPNNFSQDKFLAEVEYIVESYAIGDHPSIYKESPFPDHLAAREVASYL